MTTHSHLRISFNHNFTRFQLLTSHLLIYSPPTTHEPPYPHHPGTMYSRHAVLEDEGEMDVVIDSSSSSSGGHAYHTKKHTNTGAKPAYQSFLGQVMPTPPPPLC